MDAVRLAEAGRRYGSGGGAVTALDRMTLGFGTGPYTVPTGPSGSARSTLSRVAPC